MEELLTRLGNDVSVDFGELAEDVMGGKNKVDEHE